jgi:hypothetical protein
MFISCSSAENDKKAYGIIVNGKYFLKLKGKRVAMAHDPVSLFKDRSYQDSVMIEVPTFMDGVIKGEDIPVRKGYYSFSGTIMIQERKVWIDLYWNNTDDKRTHSYSWNGKYQFIKP